MKRRHLSFPKLPDPVKEVRVDELLRICAAFEIGNRPIPGHVRRELVLLSDHWGRRDIPAMIIEAQRVLRSSAR